MEGGYRLAVNQNCCETILISHNLIVFDIDILSLRPKGLCLLHFFLKKGVQCLFILLLVVMSNYQEELWKVVGLEYVFALSLFN